VTTAVQDVRLVPMMINGAEALSRSGRALDILNPATGRVAARVAAADADDIDGAVRCAQDAFASWSRTSVSERAKTLHRIADAVTEAVPRLAALESECNGRPISEMRAQLGIVGELFRYNAALALAQRGETVDIGPDHLCYLERVPLGVCGVITPFNHPLTIMARSVAPALAAGNTVVVKPSELTPLTALEFARIAKQAGLPDGALNVVVGLGAEAGAALANHPLVAKLDFTGGEGAGRAISVAGASRFIEVTTELGGKSPVIVFDDAGLERAVNGIAFAGFVATGQTCVAGTRLLIQDGIYDRFVDALSQKAESIRIGDPFDPSTQLGPLVSDRQRQRAEDYVALGLAEGARIATGGRRPDLPPPFDGGFYFQPTILANVRNDMRVAQEEIFGPVLVAIPFSDEEDAIAKANDIPFGLGSAVWTRDIARAHRVARRIEAGLTWINDHHRLGPALPWGGMKASGHGKQSGREAFETFSEIKSTLVRIAPHDTDWFGGATQRLN